MYPRISKVVRLAVVLAVAAVCSPRETDRPAVERPAAVAKASFEVRLRKLHLVRPDLIPYPIYFEVYC